MADLEKVIKGLELCLANIDREGCPEECPYYEACLKYENYAVFQPMMKDALELLKAQEPLKPIIEQEMDDICSCIDNVAYCGNCGAQIGRLKQNYCSNCGKAVKWDG